MACVKANKFKRFYDKCVRKLLAKLIHNLPKYLGVK